MPALPVPRPSTIAMEKAMRATMDRVKLKLATVSGDSAMIRLDPRQTKRACEAYDESRLDIHADEGEAEDEE